MNSLFPNSDLKKVRKTTRPFRYDLNQIPYNYTVEVRNRFKGLDLIDRVPDELWTEVPDIVQEAVIKTIPKKKKCKKAKWLFKEDLQIAEKRREAKGKGEREWYTHLNAEFQRIARKDKIAFLSDQYKEIMENNRMGKSRDIFKKIRDTKGTFHAKMGSIKDRNGMDLIEAEGIKKRWQEYTEDLYKKHLHDPDNHDGMIIHLKPDILESEIKWALGSITLNKSITLRTKLVEVMESQLSCFRSWKMMLLNCCTQYVSKFGKLSSGHRTGKGQFSFQSQRKAMPKSVQTTAQLHSSHMLAK